MDNQLAAQASYGPHRYDNDQDADCDTCGHVRQIQTYGIFGKMTDSSDNAVSGATVKLMQGKAEIASTTTDGSGDYSFTGVVPGLYNVVAEKGGVTKTIMVEITSQNAVNQNIKMPDGNKNSVVEVKDNTPALVVGGVDAIAEAETVSSGETVTIKLTVEKKETPTDKAAIDSAAQGKTVELYLELSLLKTSVNGGSTTENPITNTRGKVLAVVVPYDFTGKTGVTVYRKHGTENAAALSALNAIPATPTDGTFYADSANGRITIYADKFSTYAIGYTAASQTTYTLTVNSGIGGGSYAAGTTVNISAIIPSGKRFADWTGATVANPGSTNTTLVMPAQNTTVTANFQNISNGSGGGGWSSPTTYPVETPSADGGKTAASPNNAASGTTVTITLTPDEGYKIGSVIVTDRNGKQIAVTDKGDGKYIFTMPSGKVTVMGAFTKIAGGYKDCPRDSICPIWPYTDTNLAAWYHDGIHYCVENGLMNGYGNGLFGPDDNLTRAQFTQTLFNKEGRLVVNYLLQYDDVADGAWYTEAVRWATSQGIVSSYGNGMFGPNDNITREQLAVMLWRYAGSPAATEKELHFTDADKASSYALEALRWAVENAIINGYGNGRLDPQGLATRAQVAQMLKGFFA